MGRSLTRKVGRIRDVARETGLSTATISRVMNGSARVSKATRDQVLDACRRLDYMPNPAARALSTAKSRTIAAIIPTIENSIFAKFIAGIDRRLSESGYSLVFAVSNADEDSELKAARKLLGMGAQAFILTGGAHSPDLMDMFERRNVPYVLTSIWDDENPAPMIGYDNALLAEQAVAYLAAKGHRHIAVIHGPAAESDRTRSRLAGAQRAGRRGPALSFFETSLDVEGGRDGVGQMLASAPAITAILCFSDILALGVYFGLQHAERAIPTDISVMGFDNLDWSAAVLPALTTIDLPAGPMGEDVASKLINHLEAGAPIASANLQCDIIERDSVAAPKSLTAEAR